MNEAFPRRVRVVSKRDYKNVFAAPKVKRCRFFTALYTPNELGHARVGLVISKKNAAKAIFRNSIKRIIRESFRVNQDKLNAVDIVIILKTKVKKVDSQLMRQQIDKLYLDLN